MNCAEARLFFYFHGDRLDTRLSLLLVRTPAEVDALPANGICLREPSFEGLQYCADFFSAFPAVFIVVSDPDIRSDVAAAFSDAFPRLRLYLPRDTAFAGKESLVEIIGDSQNPGAVVDRLLEGSSLYTAQGLLLLSAVEPEREEDVRAYLSGIPPLDRALGGFRPGEISIITGRRGEGKSTILSQFLLEAVAQGHRVCAFSGEMSAQAFLRVIMLQSAGPYLVEKKVGPGGSEYYEPLPGAATKIRTWWGRDVYLLDNRVNISGSQRILELFRKAALLYGVDVFLLDNLLTTTLSSDRDFYREQSNFVGQLKALSVELGVHVHIVAHPRKGESGAKLSAEDVAGSGGIVDRADVVLALERTDEDGVEHDAALRILKDRRGGALGYVPLCYDQTCRRFYSPLDGGTADRELPWRQSGFREITTDEPLPF